MLPCCEPAFTLELCYFGQLCWRAEQEANDGEMPGEGDDMGWLLLVVGGGRKLMN